MSVIEYPIGYNIFYFFTSLLVVWEDSIGYPFTLLAFTSYKKKQY